jgi:hypothetical protein
MTCMNDMAKMLMVMGGGLFLVGLILYLGGRVPWLDNMPGNLVVKGDNFTVYAPIGTMIVVSILLTLILNVIARWFR